MSGNLSIRTGGSTVEKIWYNRNSKAKIALFTQREIKSITYILYKKAVYN